jgi:hypothetical protein
VTAKISRAPLWRGDGAGLDVTRKTGKGLGLAFAPPWDMVEAHKHGRMSDEDYTLRYQSQLEGIHDERYHELWRLAMDHFAGRLVLRCYCKDGVFCHTYLLINHLLKRFPDLFSIV